MKNVLRKSAFNDYVAVDIVDENDKIISTPIYLKKGKEEGMKCWDEEEARYYYTKIIFDGNKLQCTSSDGLRWESDVSELVDLKQFKPI